ncbi:hypothetical protein F5X96DRAFT_680519 [Biscogniauxia mediterranea]|nr:hypothetical protein F5X96DRAFT_680519 [Biscogniauxia mediterranea]
MADEDFEIDVYGDANAEADSRNEDSNTQAYDNNSSITIANGSNPPEQESSEAGTHANNNHGDYDARDQESMDVRESSTPAQSYQQGVKRKGDSDDRPVDPGATNCLLLSELHWWTTDDDIRSWVRQASCEDELKDITFSEHKVNGKSKGQAYLEFSSQQAATAAKRQIESAGSEPNQPGGKKHSVIYSSPTNNPFRTLPKDAPARANKDSGSRGGSTSGGYNDRGGGNFRGRGGFSGPRGGFNRNFGGGGGGGMGGGGFHNNIPGGGFNNNMGGGNFGFNSMGGGGGGNFGFRGGMMGGGMGGGMRGGGMRGGRGGMNPGMNPAMGSGMNNGMMGGMGGMGMPMMGFPQQPFNAGFFAGNQQSDWQNPHGAKRPRGE